VRLFKIFKKISSRSVSKANRRLATDFHKKFNYKFNNVELLLEALTHRSYIYYNNGIERSSERLEFLGDSVLGLIIAEYMFKSHPDYEEGDLTKYKALLVNETTLSLVAQDSGLNDLVFLSPEEEKSGGRTRSSIVSDSVEAVIGAIYLDGSLKEARKFIYNTIVPHAAEIFADRNQRNYKGELLEYLQHRGQPPPFYDVISEEGPDHDKVFNVAVTAFGKVAGSGSGSSKKEAEQKAAAAALINLNKKEQ
jgi:ribonuclease-3